MTIATSQIVPESVAEFQVMQNPYSVEFGRNSGGQINVITKSGSNHFRGDFSNTTGSGLNSRTNIEKANNLIDPAKLIRHQLGGDVGGPVFRDKLFFFGLYQRDSQRPATARARRRSGSRHRPAMPRCRMFRSGRTVGGEPAGGSAGDLVPPGRLRASPVFRNVNNSW